MENKPKSTKKISQSSIFRSVASSTAIETGQTVQTIEAILKAKKNKFQHLQLAD